MTEQQIRENLSQALRGTLPAQDFEVWLAQSSWNMHLTESLAVQQLVAEIELALAELDSRLITPEEAREILTSIASAAGET